ncbi:MAG: glutamate 5-kinase [Armatimonadota bacterium]
MREFKRIVIKVGTSTLTSGGEIDQGYLASLAYQIASLSAHSANVLVVTSGAIRAGMSKLGFTERPATIPEKQAVAAVGQSLLMQMYQDAFSRVGLTAGQVLLTREDFGDRKRYLNARNTMLTLFHHGVVPVVNENDTVAVDELRVGDNDNLAALVAASLEADLLVILSDVPGLYDAHPESESACLIPRVTKIDKTIRAIAGGAGGDGTGGMRTKIEAASVCMNCGVTMVIADGRRENVVLDAAEGKEVGTVFVPADESLCHRKRWLAFGAAPRGSITVNEGAVGMIRERGKSLLAAGITGVSGRFGRGHMVQVLDPVGNPFARGFVNYSAGEIERLMGRKSSEIEGVLGYKDFDEIIHRDNMVLRG